MALLNTREAGKSSTEALDEFHTDRHDRIKPFYQRYLSGEFSPCRTHQKSSVTLVPASELDIHIERKQGSSDLCNVSVVHATDPDAVNFMAVDADEGVVVFRGEAGLFDQFFEFTSVFLKGDVVNGALSAAVDIKIPSGGLEEGLSYDDFAARVEIVEYALLVESPPESEQPQAADEASIQWEVPSRSSPSSSSTSVYPEQSLSSDEYAHSDEPKSKSPETEKTPRRRKSSSGGSSSSGSSSTLSPPPAVIKTPPTLEEFSFRLQCESRDIQEGLQLDFGGVDEMPKGPKTTKNGRASRGKSGKL